MNRSHLVPTTVVDKNGVSTIRYKKPSTSRTTLIAPVSTKSEPANLPFREGSEEHLMHILWGKSASYDDGRMLRLISDDDPSSIELTVNSLTTGSAAARMRTQMCIEALLWELAYAHDAAEEDDFWRDRCPQAWSPLLKHNLAGTWNSSNVLHELGPEYKDVDRKNLEKDIAQIDRSINPLARHVDRSEDFTYWRGLTVAALSKVDVPERNFVEVKRFAFWSGEHSDMSSIITTVSERKTFNVTNLEAIMKQQSIVAPALRQGAL